MKPLYIVGTHRDVGKTTTSVGLAHAFRKRGLRVGYMKPLGQRLSTADGGHVLHEDARLVGTVLGPGSVEQVDMDVPLPSGRVEQEILEKHPTQLFDRVKASYQSLAKNHDLVVIEGMGHVAAGACLRASSAEVCQCLGAKALLVSGGGIGRAIDDIALCSTFITARGAELAGVVVNKVWPQKYTRIKVATTQGLADLGIRSFGTVPFEQELSSPTMRDVYLHIGGELLAGQEHLDHRVRHTIIAAMESHHMIRFIEGSTLVITPGDRKDNILASLRAHMLGDHDSPAVSGLILTGDYLPEESVLQAMKEFHLPVIAVKGDTYTTASRIVDTVFKIPPNDHQRIEWAVCLVAEYVDADAILEALKD